MGILKKMKSVSFVDAVRRQDWEFALWLLPNVNVEACQWNGAPLLSYCVLHNEVERVRFLLERCGQVATYPLLYTAVHAGFPEMTALLLRRGAPLMHAKSEWQQECVYDAVSCRCRPHWVVSHVLEEVLWYDTNTQVLLSQIRSAWGDRRKQLEDCYHRWYVQRAAVALVTARRLRLGIVAQVPLDVVRLVARVMIQMRHKIEHVF